MINFIITMEKHPYISSLSSRIKNPKIILGSFPTWSLTTPDPEKNETVEMKKNGDIPFFYGSSSNKFWSWYKAYIDASIVVSDIDTIVNSLIKNSIGITDMIFSCKRRNKSASDIHLTKRSYNHEFFEYPERRQSIKILCTSKGVMNDMLLNKKFFKIHPRLIINEEASSDFQKELSKKFNGDLGLVKKPFYQKVDIESGGAIECFALPSPGSPHRRLIDFGRSTNDNTQLFLDDYLKTAFRWFNN